MPRCRGKRILATVGAFVLVVGCKQSPDQGATSTSSLDAEIAASGSLQQLTTDSAAAKTKLAGAAPGKPAMSTLDAGRLVDVPRFPEAPGFAPVRGKSIGHTSVVFALTDGDGKKAAFKPASRRGPSRYKGEIAAYRLALALRLSNVPPAFAVSFARKTLEDAIAGSQDARELLRAEGLEQDGVVHGALIPWVDSLAFLPLEVDPLRAHVRGWLTDGHAMGSDPISVPTGNGGRVSIVPRALAADTSTMAIFDVLTGNWDRWSGANVGYDRERGILLFVDNDGAFAERPPASALAANLAHLQRIDRFSRAAVQHLRALDDAALDVALGDERPGTPLLTEVAVRGVRGRRDEALRIIDAKIAAHGEDKTLFFP